MSAFGDDPLDPRGDALGDPPADDAAPGADAFESLGAATPEMLGDVDAALSELERYLGGARAGTLSPLVRIDRDHALELIRLARSRLPVALRSARWLIKERDDYLARARRDAEDLVDQGKAEAARMVQRTEVVKQAEMRARRIVEQAEEHARRRRLELEDYCDEHLARFEVALTRALESVHAGRRKLQGEAFDPAAPQSEAPPETDDGLFFNQDLT